MEVTFEYPPSRCLQMHREEPVHNAQVRIWGVHCGQGQVSKAAGEDSIGGHETLVKLVIITHHILDVEGGGIVLICKIAIN